MYRLQGFDLSGNEILVYEATREEAFAVLKEMEGVRAIDVNGWVFTAVNDVWKWGGINSTAQVAGARAGSQNFSLINPPK